MRLNRRGFIKTVGVITAGMVTLPGPATAQAKKNKFISKLGICTGISNNKILASSGYAFLEEGVRSLLIPQEPDEAFNEKLDIIRNSAIPVEACNGFLPADLKSTGPEAVHEKIAVFAETAFRRAEKAGVKIIVFGSSGSRNIPDGFSREEAKNQFVSLCRQIGPSARKYGVTVCIEPLNRKECNFINSLEEGAEIVNLTDDRNIKLHADIYHMLVENEGPENIEKYCKLIHHVHIAEKEGRTAPGTHGEDFTPYLRALRKGGYSGRLSIEGGWENLEVQAPKAFKVLKEQISEVID
jgi:sugar phosphate isomerase/epimerase